MKNMEDFKNIVTSEKVDKLTGGDCIEAFTLQAIINFEKEYSHPCLRYQELAHSVGCGDNDFAVGVLSLLEKGFIKHFKVVIDGEEYQCYKSNI